MPTNLDLDDKLIERARRAGKHKTKKEAVTAALREYIQHRQRLRVLKMAGRVDYVPGHDYKAERKRR